MLSPALQEGSPGPLAQPTAMLCHIAADLAIGLSADHRGGRMVGYGRWGCCDGGR